MPSFTFDRTWTFDVAPERFWAVIEATDDFPRWAGSLSDYRSEGLRPGAVTRAAVRAPLGYALTVRVVVRTVIAGSLIEADVDGHLRGAARLEVTPDAQGTKAHLHWTVDLRHPVLAPLVPMLRPVLTWAHDRVIDRGLAGFRRELARQG